MSPRLLIVVWEGAVLIAVALYIAQIGAYHGAEQTFPRLIAYPVAALALLSLVRRAFTWRAPAADAAEAEAVDVRALALGIALAGAYLALWQLLGFVLDTLLLLTFAPLVLGLRRSGILASAGIAIGVIVLFGYLFGTSGTATLPGGVFGIQWRW